VTRSIIPALDARRRRTLLVWLLLAYAVLLAGPRLLLGGAEPTGPVTLLIALLPVPAAVAILAFAVAQFMADDELQQRIRLIALALAFCGTLLVTFTWGFLEGIGVAPLGGFTVFGILVALYLAGLLAAGRKYR
jgi:hypothetical protein